jgi:phage terminase Nu1 subunit (DNA packaging protein)
MDLVSPRDLALKLGVTTRTITDLADRGIVVRIAKGKYDLWASITNYIANLRETAAGRGGENGVLDLTAERARLAKEQADGHQLKNEITRGQMVLADDVARVWGDEQRAIRAAMLSVPSRIQQDNAGFSRSDIAAIDRAIRDVLAEAGNDDA